MSATTFLERQSMEAMLEQNHKQRLQRLQDHQEGDDEAKRRFKPFHEEKWDQKLLELRAFRKKNGHCLVPHTYPPNPQLARWVKRQRRQFKLMQEGATSTMTMERVAILDQDGFVWDSHEAAWKEKIEDLRAYRAKHGHCLVPSQYKGNPQLATWVKCQRRQYKLYWEGKPSAMNPSRIKELESEGFRWELRNVGSSKAKRVVAEDGDLGEAKEGLEARNPSPPFGKSTSGAAAALDTGREQQPGRPPHNPSMQQAPNRSCFPPNLSALPPNRDVRFPHNMSAQPRFPHNWPPMQPPHRDAPYNWPVQQPPIRDAPKLQQPPNENHGGNNRSSTNDLDAAEQLLSLKDLLGNAKPAKTASAPTQQQRLPDRTNAPPIDSLKPGLALNRQYANMSSYLSDIRTPHFLQAWPSKQQQEGMRGQQVPAEGFSYRHPRGHGAAPGLPIAGGPRPHALGRAVVPPRCPPL